MEAFAIPDARERLNAAVDGLLDESIDGFSTHALGADLVDIRRAADRLEAEFLRRLDRFDRGHGADADGYGNTASWLRDHCGMAWKTGAYRARLARTLGELPATLESARAGRVPFANATLIANLADAVGVEQVAPLEHIFVDAAERLEPGAMRTLTRGARIRLDPDGVLADDNRAHKRRWFDLDQSYEGQWFAQGQFDAEGGALVKTLIDAYSLRATPEDQRSVSERRADALVDLAAAQLRCGNPPTVHGQRPHLTLTVSAAALPTDADAEAADLRGVGPIHPETARRIACDAVKTEVTVAAPADDAAWTAITGAVVPLSVGRATRTIPAPIRTALCVRDQGCRFPGCDRPISWTDGHHIVHWADGGPTELDNLVSLCRRHHRAVHEQGWRIRMEDGVPVVEPPP